MANCKKCSKPIKWAKTEEGRFIPMEKGTDVKELLMVVDYEENEKGWKTPVVKSMRLYEAHRNHCTANDDWQPFQQKNDEELPPPPPPEKAQPAKGFSFNKEEKMPSFVDEDLPF